VRTIIFYLSGLKFCDKQCKHGYEKHPIDPISSKSC
jgi:hypothetical protein